MANQLAASSSPYLRQHAGNPVDWREWGAEPFAEARERDVPVFISIGYAACHWCHVMAHESFDDPATAAELNEHFVCIKIDREERPDVDAVYMDATVAMTGQGGWPMSVFATPDGRPFYCGTYYPPEPRGGMSSFRQLLAAVTDTWRTRRDDVEQVAGRATEVLSDPAMRRGHGGGAGLEQAELEQAVLAALPHYDLSAGGVGRAPKFPVPVFHAGMLAAARGLEAEDVVRGAVDVTLDAMARGGIHDHLAGGFARYSVDHIWAVPHFEKMLYDNALLLSLYSRRVRAALIDSDDAATQRYRAVCDGIVSFLGAYLDTGRGLASSLDADSLDPGSGRSVEGAAYVWTPAQLADVLGTDDGARVAATFQVTEAGSFDSGTSTLRLAAPLDPGDLDWWVPVRDRLRTARDTRPQPARDDKVVTEWNAQAVTALVELGGSSSTEGRALLLQRAADLADHLPTDPVLRSRLGDEWATAPGTLADHAAVATALLRLGAATADTARLETGLRVLERALADFAGDAPGRWYDAAPDPALPFRPSDPTDGATPGGASQLAEALLVASAVGPADVAGRYRELAQQTIDDAGGVLRSQPVQAGGWMRAAALLAQGPVHVAVRGDKAAERAAELEPMVPVDVIVQVVGDSSGDDAFEVCRGTMCLPPTADVHAAAESAREVC